MWNAELCSKSFSTAVLIYGVLKLFVLYKYFVIAVRVSGGHLCEAEAPTEPVGETAERRAAIRFSPPRHCEHRKVRGNPFSFKREIRILSCYALRMTNRLVATNTVRCAVSCRSVIAKVRVSGGHLCGAEAPTEPAGET